MEIHPSATCRYMMVYIKMFHKAHVHAGGVFGRCLDYRGAGLLLEGGLCLPMLRGIAEEKVLIHQVGIKDQTLCEVS